ncbi:MAG: hypothetical protein RLZZ225_488 [Pseudomonadota bacterium]|jgi:hypothetical protein
MSNLKVNFKLEYIQEREEGLNDIQADLLEHFPRVIDDKSRLEKFSTELKRELSENGQTMYENGLNRAPINQTIAKDFKEEYETTLAESIERLKGSIDTAEIIEKAQSSLQEKLKSKKNKLVEKLISLLSQNGQGFNAADKPRLETHLSAYLSEINQQLTASLARIKPESIQARLQLEHANSASSKNNPPVFEVKGKREALDQANIAPQAPPLAPAYKINIADLSKRIKHSLAHLKPGEKINIVVGVPLNREDSLKRIAEQGLQYRTSLAALLLLIFIQLQMIKKDDETRVHKAIKKLAASGIVIDPKDIKFTVSSVDNNGKTQVLAEGLSPYSIQQLEQTRQKFAEQLEAQQRASKKSSSLSPSESGYNSEEDDEDAANNSSSPRSPRNL